MKLLLINPILPELFSRAHTLPLGYLSLDAWLTKHGHEVDLLFPEQHLWRGPQILDYIDKNRPDMIGMGGCFDWLNVGAHLSYLIRQRFPDTKQIFGGIMASPNPKLCFQIAPIDYVCCGEGEIALQKLLDALDKGESTENIQGICYVKDGKFFDRGRGEPVDLDEIPEFNWDKINMAHYAYNWQLKSPLLPYQSPLGFFITGRGCPYNCNFCFSIQKYRRLSFEKIFEHLDSYVERFKPRFMAFNDDTFCASHKWTLEFCERLKEKSYGFKYSCSGRVNTFNEGMAKALKESGCAVVHLALENADNEILKRMNKKITVEQFLECIKIAKGFGLIPNVSAMLGQPGESKETIEKTASIILDVLDESNPWATISYFLLRIYPGSPLYKEAKASGFFKDDLEFYQRHLAGKPIWMCGIPIEKAKSIVGNVGNIIQKLSHAYMSGSKKQGSIKFTLN